MRRSRVVPVVLAALAAGTAITAVAGSRADAAPRLPVVGGSALTVVGGKVLGASTRQHVPVSLVLASRDVAGQDAAVAAGTVLTPQQYAARFGPTAAQVAAVTRWARTAGLTVTDPAGGLVLSLDGTAAQVGRAFGTTLADVALPGGTTGLAPLSAATLPAGVASSVTAAVGLNELGALRTAARSAVSYPASYTPQQIAAIYQANTGASGTGVPVTVLAAGDMTQVVKDLRTFEARYRLPQVPVSVVAAPKTSADTTGTDEWDLDTQYATGLAPNVSRLYLYAGPGLDTASITAEIGQWVRQRPTRQASFSAGLCEVLASAAGFTTGLDAVLRQAAVQGQTLFTASGDTGSFCPLPVVSQNGVPVGGPGPEYPASSPYAIGVGGTTVLDPSGPTETAWVAGGGGPSLTEPVPAWQKNAGGSFVGVTRGVPDVALDGDPESGYQVVVNGAVETIGGTSASAPAWQGLWARAQSAHRGTLGFAGPILYALPATTFHDVVLGTQGLFVASPGWDYTTGRGTPIGSLLSARA